MGHGIEDHRGRNYKIRLTKTRCIINGMKRDVKASPISLEEYLRNEMLKSYRTQTIKSVNS